MLTASMPFIKYSSRLLNFKETYFRHMLLRNTQILNFMLSSLVELKMLESERLPRKC